MRRCRLNIGDKVQAEIIDNLKPSLYQTTPKHTEKKNKLKIVCTWIPYKQPPLSSWGFITECLKLKKSSRFSIWPRSKNEMPSAYVEQ